MNPNLLLAACVLFCWLLHNLGILGRALFLVAYLVSAWAFVVFRVALVGEDISTNFVMSQIAKWLPWDSVLLPWDSLVRNANKRENNSLVDNSRLILGKPIMGVTCRFQNVHAVCSAVIIVCIGRFLCFGDDDMTQSLRCFLAVITLSMFVLRHRAFVIAVAVPCLLSILANAAEPLVRMILPQIASRYSNNRRNVFAGSIVSIWLAGVICRVIQDWWIQPRWRRGFRFAASSAWRRSCPLTASTVSSGPILISCPSSTCSPLGRHALSRTGTGGGSSWILISSTLLFTSATLTHPQGSLYSARDIGSAL